MKYAWVMMLVVTDAIWLWRSITDIRITKHLNSKTIMMVFNVKWSSKMCVILNLFLIFAASLTKWLGVW